MVGHLFDLPQRGKRDLHRFIIVTPWWSNQAKPSKAAAESALAAMSTHGRKFAAAGSKARHSLPPRSQRLQSNLCSRRGERLYLHVGRGQLISRECAYRVTARVPETCFFRCTSGDATGGNGSVSALRRPAPVSAPWPGLPPGWPRCAWASAKLNASPTRSHFFDARWATTGQ